jgi:hypothetical protein
MSGAAPQGVPAPRKHRPAILPTTSLGARAMWLAVAAVVFNFAWRILPGGAALAFACGIASGIVALVAILRRRERAVIAYAAVLPLIFVVVFILAELLIGHP